MSNQYTTWFEGAGNNLDYFSQYENAIKFLLKECVNNEKIDSLVLPTLFLIRHCLELGLKYNIKFFSEYSQKNDFLKKLNSSHNLESLFEVFCVHIRSAMDEIGYQNKDNSRCAVEIQIEKSKFIIKFLEKLDKYGTTFRYATDKNGQRSLKRSDNFDIRTLENSFEECLKLLWHSEDVLSDGIKYYDYMKNEIESGCY